MDERTIKRLLIIVAVSIIAIVLIKMGLTKTYSTLNKAAAEKKQAAITKPAEPQQVPAPPVATEVIEPPASPPVAETASVEAPASSSVSETR